VISDEAHRSIGGNSRAVFEYFVGYKLGLTATPKNYFKGLTTDDLNNQREYERRLLIDTYKTFGCEPGHPTFSYDLEKGANDGFLIKPTLVDARTEVTTQLLSDEGYSVRIAAEDGIEVDKLVFDLETANDMAETTRHGLSVSYHGWFDDDVACCSDWGFDIGAIKVPVQLWQGDQDLMVPHSHGYYLHAKMPDSKLVFKPGEGHVSLVVNDRDEIISIAAVLLA
jgi:pimeloyl-ACP methyl ester carboxylesterase